MLDMGYEKKMRRSAGAETGFCSDAGQITDVGAQAFPDLSMSDDKDTETPLGEYEACLAADDMVEEPKSDKVATGVVVPDMDEEAIPGQVIPTMATAETAEEMMKMKRHLSCLRRTCIGQIFHTRLQAGGPSRPRR
ncbi:uncharacterized protein LOC144133857 [Amblyomma americanum]